MMRWWKFSETILEEPQCMNCGPIGSSRFPQRVLWGSLTVTLLIVVIALIALIVTGQFTLQADTQSSLQVVRIIASDYPAALINQSAVVDKHNSVVTYSVTSHTNHTSTVLFDLKHGLICYKPDNQESCFLRQMETSDYENMHVLLNESKQQVNQIWLVGNETQRHTEFLGVLSGHHVDASVLQQPLQALCQHKPVYWTRRAGGPKERLIYFCIDICFPNNICVSVCFYYLPE
ncbi:BRICHOS domain-containing protein 5 isoform X1 [Tachysurus vachellii]|uniref:BRICHOS domain-containing protein 5 isoform X1 n=1 Tax=Tachysurus vachellii TaxID=175792 RepID=UPI00296B2D62|nr:BRICHOS domain-containing protein 5 isoform X1 [Tachysurus vachellii]